MKLRRTSPRGATDLKTWILTVLGCILTNLLKFLKNLIWEALGVIRTPNGTLWGPKSQGFPTVPQGSQGTPKAPQGSPQGVSRSQGPPKRLPREVLGRGVCTKYVYSDSVPRCVCMLSFSPGLNLSPWRCSNRHRTLCYSRTLTMRNIIVIH